MTKRMIAIRLTLEAKEVNLLKLSPKWRANY